MRNDDIEIGGEYAAAIGWSTDGTKFSSDHAHVKVVEKKVSEDHPTRAFTKIEGTRVELVEPYKQGGIAGKTTPAGEQLVVKNRDIYKPWADYVPERTTAKIRFDRNREMRRIEDEKRDRIRQLFNDYVAHLDLDDPSEFQRGVTGSRRSFGPLALTEFAHGVAAGGEDLVVDLKAEIQKVVDESTEKSRAVVDSALKQLADEGFEPAERDQLDSVLARV